MWDGDIWVIETMDLFVYYPMLEQGSQHFVETKFLDFPLIFSLIIFEIP